MRVAAQLRSQASPGLKHDALDGLQPECLRASSADQSATLAHYALGHGEPEALVLAGVHGREHGGILASLELLLRPADGPLYDRMGMIPVCSPLAPAAETRLTPVSDRYMARAFAPDAPGDLTEALSHAVVRVAQRADVALNLHSAGDARYLPHAMSYRELDADFAASSMPFYHSCKRDARVSDQFASCRDG